jgi:rubrerythrin
LFEKAKQAVEQERDVEINGIQVFEVWGNTLEGEAPDECPVCSVKKEKLKSFD